MPVHQIGRVVQHSTSSAKLTRTLATFKSSWAARAASAKILQSKIVFGRQNHLCTWDVSGFKTREYPIQGVWLCRGRGYLIHGIRRFLSRARPNTTASGAISFTGHVRGLALGFLQVQELLGGFPTAIEGIFTMIASYFRRLSFVTKRSLVVSSVLWRVGPASWISGGVVFCRQGLFSRSLLSSAGVSRGAS